MNKKGYDYAALMVIVVIIAVSTLYVQVVKKTSGMERVIGENQAAILTLNSEVTLYQLYVRGAAKLAATTCFTGPVDPAFNERLNSHMQKYAVLKDYKIPASWEVAFTDGKLIGVALEPTTIKIKDKTGKQIGTALYKPTFSIPASLCPTPPQQ